MSDDAPHGPLADSVGRYLRADEEIVVVDGMQAIDFWKARRETRGAPTPGGGRFPRGRMGVVITTQRLLMFRVGALAARVEELVADLPLADVDRIACQSHALRSFEVTLTVRGVDRGFVLAHISHGRRMEKALATAKHLE